MNIFSIFYKILIISILCASKIINIEFEIGIFDCQNEINSYKILILTILLERSFIEAFSIIYILIRKLRQKNKVIDYKAKNTIETILFIKMFKNSPFKINTILLIEQKLYDLSNSSLWERKNKNFTVIKEELLNLLVSILFSKFSDAIFLKQNLRIFSKDGRIELNSLEWLKIFVPKMRDYTKEVNFGLIEELVACNVRVGGRSHSAIALKPDGVSKAVSTNVDTSKNFVRIGGEFYATAEKSDNNFEYPFSFQLTKLNELQIRLNQETRIMSSYVMGETISNVCAYNLKQSLDTKMYQWKFLFENALQRAIAELEGRYDFQVFLQYKKSKDSLLIDELGIDKFLTDGQNIINIHLKSITDLILSSFGETQFTSIADPIQEMIKSSVDLKREKPDFTDLEKNFIESKRMKFSESGGQVQQLAQAQQIIGAENIPEILTERGLQIKKEKIGSLKLMLEKSKAMNINDFTIIVLDSSDELALSTVTKLIEM